MFWSGKKGKHLLQLNISISTVDKCGKRSVFLIVIKHLVSRSFLLRVPYIFIKIIMLGQKS